MSRKGKQHDKQFKFDALKYVREHPDLTQEECCKNLGIGLSTLSRWKQQYEKNDGDIPVRVPVTTLLMSRRKSPVSSVNFVMPRTPLMS